MNTTTIIVVIFYFVLVLAIGYFVGRKESKNDFLIANRNLGLVQTTCSIVAVVGGVLLVGQTALAFQLGFTAMGFWIGMTFGMVVLGFVVRKVRSAGHFVSMSEFVKAKFGKNASYISAVILFMALFGLLTGQFIAGSNLLAPLLNVSYWLGVIVLGIIVMAYLFLGGFKAVVRTDVVQAICMVMFLVLVLVFIPKNLGNILSVGMSSFDILTFIILFLLGFFVVFCSGDIWQRLFAAKSTFVAKYSLLFSSLIYLIIGLILTIVGVIASTSVNATLDIAIYVGLFELMPDLFLPISILIVLTMIMSTIDTELFYLSSSISRDFLKRKDVKSIIRISLFSISLVSMLLAIFVSNILDLLFGLISLAMIIAPSILCSFFWKVDKISALASMISGLVVFIVLLILGTFNADTAILVLPVSIVLLIVCEIGILFSKRC